MTYMMQHHPITRALLLACISTLTVSSTPPPPQYLFSNPPPPHTYSIPTIHDSAILARRILNISTIATLSTVFPIHNALPLSKQPHYDPSSPSHYTSRDLNVDGAPVGLMDYYAACPPNPADPTILAISIATSFRNARAGSNVSMSLRWQPPSTAPPSNDPYTYSAANMPRFSLEGHMEAISEEEVEREGVEECFLRRHGDAEAWRPGNQIHESWWGRLVVEGVYWIGGFGDRAYIGWITKEEWERVTEGEVKKARLVGEDGYDAYEAQVRFAGKGLGEL